MKRSIFIYIFLLIPIANYAASLTFPKIYPGTLTNNKLDITTPVASTSFKFISANPALPAFSGNNIGGTLNFTLNGQQQTINGWINLRVGNTDGVVFEETTVLGGTVVTGRLWLLIYPASLSVFTDNQTLISCNSAGVGSSLDELRIAQNSYADPVITSNGGGLIATLSIAENSTTVTTNTATVYPAGGSGQTAYPASTKTFSISGGVDAAKFSIDAASGVLTFVTAPDFENPTDAGLNNVYDVQITVTDTQGTTDTQAIAVTITNTNDNSPVITSNGGGSSATINLLTSDLEVTTVTATDADYGDVLSYSITGGADAALFSINPNSGYLTFKDAHTNGTYYVTVTVTDGNNHTDTQDLTIVVSSTDTTAPSVVITSSDVNLSANESCTISFRLYN